MLTRFSQQLVLALVCAFAMAIICASPIDQEQVEAGEGEHSKIGEASEL